MPTPASVLFFLSFLLPYCHQILECLCFKAFFYGGSMVVDGRILPKSLEMQRFFSNFVA
jgi:hypothetical protein